MLPTWHKLCSKRLPRGQKISVQVGPALETSKLAAAQESFDLVFIDADKQEYVHFHLLLSSLLP